MKLNARDVTDANTWEAWLVCVFPAKHFHYFPPLHVQVSICLASANDCAKMDKVQQHSTAVCSYKI